MAENAGSFHAAEAMEIPNQPPDLEEAPYEDSTFGDEGSPSEDDFYVEPSEIFDENGRTYYNPKGGKQPASLIDDEEKQRQYEEHLLCIETFGGLSTAPFDPKDVFRTLDLTARFGIWAHEFAGKHNHIVVIGMVSFPASVNDLHPNCELVFGDLESWGWRIRFDLIRGECLMAKVGDWTRFCTRAYQQLNPGGWVELIEKTYPLRCESTPIGCECDLIGWSENIVEAETSFNIKRATGMEIERCLGDAGFVNVRQKIYRWHLQPRTGDWGAQQFSTRVRQTMLAGIGEWSEIYLKWGLKWDPQSLEVYLVNIRKAIQDPKSRVYIPVTVFTAQKPPNQTDNNGSEPTASQHDALKTDESHQVGHQTLQLPLAATVNKRPSQDDLGASETREQKRLRKEGG